jgi:hypothetical protein
VFGRRSRQGAPARPDPAPHLAGVADVDDARRTAADPDTAADVLDALADHESPHVRAVVAWNRSAAPEVLARLAHDSFAVVRYRLAGNPNTDADTLAFLAQDPVEPLLDTHHRQGIGWAEAGRPELANIRSTVAKHPNTPESTLWSLAADGFAGAVAANPAASAEMLARLAQDALDSYVEYDDRLARVDEDLRVRALLRPIARNPNTPPDLLLEMAQRDSASTD